MPNLHCKKIFLLKFRPFLINNLTYWMFSIITDYEYTMEICT